ncbi:MAG: efflux RND transporter periplasmic adaptor subunit [Bacteroidia bacterium]
MKKSKNKLLIWLGIAIVILIIIAVVGKKKGWFGGKDEIRVSMAVTEIKTVIETVNANGKIQPETEVKISSDVSGEIRELYVKEGDSVTVGQLLARIDPELYASALDRSSASLSNAKANSATSKARLTQAEARFAEIEKQFNRSKKMAEQKLISEAEIETATSSYKNAKAEVDAIKQNVIGADFTVKSFEASLKESKKNLTRTEIFAPVSGIVSSLKVEKGERVVGTSQMAGTEMMRIANLNAMEVSVDVNENDIIKVGLGDTVLIEVDAYGTRKFKGLVSEIANSASANGASTSDQVTNFIVKIKILRSSYADLTAKFGKRKAVFRPGMSASVEIQTEIANKVLAIPIEAVTVRQPNDLDTSVADKKEMVSNTDSKDEVEVVFVSNNNTAAIRKIVTGIQDDKLIVITSGLAKGDIVISGPYATVSKTLKHGDKLKKVTKEELFEVKK